MTREEAEQILERLSEHFGERVAPVSRYCAALDTWARTAAEAHGIKPEVAAVRMALMKSNLAARLVYGGEQLRTRQCPEHRGIWSGIEFPDDFCTHGCGKTGWLPESATPAESQEGER